MIADELRLYTSILGLESPQKTPAAMMGLVDESRDPVSGRAVDPAVAIPAEHNGKTYYFVSQESRDQFLEDPERFSRSISGLWRRPDTEE
jgi:YHS domain-containing protein